MAGNSLRAAVKACILNLCPQSLRRLAARPPSGGLCFSADATHAGVAICGGMIILGCYRRPWLTMGADRIARLAPCAGCGRQCLFLPQVAIGRRSMSAKVGADYELMARWVRPE